MGAKSLIDSNQGSLAFIVPREGYTDTVVTFPLMDGANPNTTWFRFISFPLFVLNALQALGNMREGTGDEIAEPGEPIVLHPETPSKTITVAPLGGGTVETVTRSPQGSFVFNRADKTGVYMAQWEKDGRLPFAVNLFDVRESDVATRGIAPDGTPDALARKATRSRSGIALSPERRSRRWCARTSGGTSRCWYWACCSSSGMFIIGEFLFKGGL